jgi:hypothetical protein
MHVGSTLDAFKKCGHFKDHDKAKVLYVSLKEAGKQAKAALALLDGVSKGEEKSKKSSRKAKEAKKRLKNPTQKCKQVSYCTSRRPRKPPRVQ